MIIELRVVHERPNTALPDGEPAHIDSNGTEITVQHARFSAFIDPFARTGTIRCLEGDRAFATELTHRAALSAILPLEGGVLLHSAGIVIDGNAIAFFGPSGAGKSTLASLVEEPALSDELILIRRDGDAFVAEASGTWGELGARPAIEGRFPLAHLVALGRGEHATLDSLGVHEAARLLIAVMVVPPQPELWRAAMNVVEKLARLPTSRLRWTPSKENARAVVSALR